MLDRYNNRKPSTGTLYLTATHLIFVDPDAKKETWVLDSFLFAPLRFSSCHQFHPLNKLMNQWFDHFRSGSTDACSDRAKAAFIDRWCTPADPMQDIFVSDFRVASRTGMPRPLYKPHANVPAM